MEMFYTSGLTLDHIFFILKKTKIDSKTKYNITIKQNKLEIIDDNEGYVYTWEENRNKYVDVRFTISIKKDDEPNNKYNIIDEEGNIGYAVPVLEYKPEYKPYQANQLTKYLIIGIIILIFIFYFKRKRT